MSNPPPQCSRYFPAAKGPVFASEPGESNCSPLWHEVFVSWKAAMSPTLLKSDTAVEAKIKQGQLIEKHTHIVLNCPIVKACASSSGSCGGMEPA